MPAAAVPEITPVVALSARPEGHAPCTTEKVGLPEAATVKVPAVPTVKVARAALVKARPAGTSMVKVWVPVPVGVLAASMKK